MPNEYEYEEHRVMISDEITYHKASCDDAPLLTQAPPQTDIEKYFTCLEFTKKLGNLVSAGIDCATWEITSTYLTNQGFSPISPTYIVGTGAVPACSELVKGVIVYYLDEQYRKEGMPKHSSAHIKESAVKITEYFFSSMAVNAAWSPLYYIAQTLGFASGSTVVWIGGISAIICFLVIILIRALFKLIFSAEYIANRFNKKKFIELFKHSFETSFISGVFVLQMPGYPVSDLIPQSGYLNSTATSALLGVAGQLTAWGARGMPWLLGKLWTSYGNSLASNLWKELSCAPLTEIVICK